MVSALLSIASDFVLVLDIDVDGAFAIGDGELGPPPGRSMVATTLPVFASMTVELWLSPFMVSTRLVAGSYTILSASLSAFASPTTFKVFRSNMITLACAPSVINPRPNSVAIATP